MSVYEMLTNDLKEQAFCGITVGIVTSLDDTEKQNRVKVRLLNRSDSMQETDFIRVMTPMAGKGFGLFAFPEVGDEVLVGFCDGDFTSPYVLGCLWNKNSAAPLTLEGGKNEVRTLQTKSGHKVVFNDGDDPKGIDLITSTGLSLKLDDKNNNITVSDKNGKNKLLIDVSKNEISVIADAKITLKAGSASVTIDGKGNAVNITSSGNVKISGQQVSIEGQSAVNIKASGQLTLEATGMTNVKGAMVKIN